MRQAPASPSGGRAVATTSAISSLRLSGRNRALVGPLVAALLAEQKTVAPDDELLRFVRTGSEGAVDEGGCSPARARARCACNSWRIRPATSTPATPAIAAKD